MTVNARTSKAATGSDVARRAGVSQSTVSRVMAGKADGRVSERVRARVKRVAHELGYRPNAAGRMLRLGTAHTVALVVPNVRHPFFASMLLGAEQTAREHGYTVMLLAAGDDAAWKDSITEALAARALDGCILYVGDPMSDRDVAGFGSNVVLVEAESARVPSVTLDIESGARAAVEHLLALGHRRIAHLAAAYDKESFRLRSVAYRRALRAAGIGFRRGLTQQARFEIADSTAAADRLLAAGAPPTAVFCDDDLLAAGVYKAAHARGLRIPTDLSVCGFTDIDLALMLEPELTTVTMRADEVGRAAMDAMMLLLGGHRRSRARRIGLELTVRASTGPPPR